MAVICSFWPQVDFASLEGSKVDNLFKDAQRRQLKPCTGKMNMEWGQANAVSFIEKRIQQLQQRLSDSQTQIKGVNYRGQTTDLVVLQMWV
ncbi:hypothetical protein ACFX14_024786 [Malus domestica]